LLGPARHLLFFLPRKMAARRAFHHPVACDPLAEVLAADPRFVVHPGGSTISLVPDAKREMPAVSETLAAGDPVGDLLRRTMGGRGYTATQVENALRLWQEASTALRPRVLKPAVWAAAVELSILRIDAPERVRASEVSSAYATGAAAASRYSGEILRALDVVPQDPRFSERGQGPRLAAGSFAETEERFMGRGEEAESGREFAPVLLHCPRCREDQRIAEPYRFVKGGRSGVAGRCPRCSKPLVRYLGGDQPARDAEGSP
jgi:hypothetical protein